MAWSTYLTDTAGRPGLALLDRQFEHSAVSAQLPRLAWFGVWCRLPVEAGFWDPAESEALERVERAFLALASQHANGWAVYVRCLSTRGLREYYLYAAAHVDFTSVLEQLRQRFPEYRLEYEHQSDAEWSLYHGWLAEVASSVE